MRLRLAVPGRESTAFHRCNFQWCLPEIGAWLEAMVGEDSPPMRRSRAILVRLGIDGRKPPNK
jgi:hypothetical protein